MGKLEFLFQGFKEELWTNRGALGSDTVIREVWLGEFTVHLQMFLDLQS